MKLLRYGPADHEQPGILDAEGRVRPLAGSNPDPTPQHLSPTGLERLGVIDPVSLPLAPAVRRLVIGAGA